MSSRSPSISSRTGWTTRQGPHQGAQKSTRTGPSASSTSALKVASVTSVSFPVTGYPSPGIEVSRLNTSESIAPSRPRSKLARRLFGGRFRPPDVARAEAQHGHPPERLGDERDGHPRGADAGA